MIDYLAGELVTAITERDEAREAAKVAETIVSDVWDALYGPEGSQDQSGDLAREVEAIAEALPTAADHLRAYLSARGYGSNPVTLPDPHLQALADALF